MTDHDFIAAMHVGLPTIPGPAAPPEILKGNADIEANHPDAIGLAQEKP